LAVCWMAGTALFFIPFLIGLCQVRSLRKSGKSWAAGQSLVETLERESGIRRRVGVLLHDSVAGPMTCGVAKPVVMLPVGAQTWSEGDLRRAVIHELEHVRRCDWLLRCIARAVCAFYWFHPLVWLAWRRFVLEGERACDDAVLQHTEATTYADQLVVLAQDLSTRRFSTMTAMAGGGDLTKRVRSLLDIRQKRGRAGAWSVAIAVVAALLFVGLISPVQVAFGAQTNNNRLEFEVASIRRNESGTPGSTLEISHGNFTAKNLTAFQLIQMAFRTQRYRILNGAAWMSTSRFDIVAKGKTAATRQEMMEMLQSLLTDRFELKFHNDTRELPIYALEVTKGGSKLIAEDLAGCKNPELPPGVFSTKCGEITQTGNAQRGAISGRAIRIGPLVLSLGGGVYLDRPVIDQTRLTGTYSFGLAWNEPGSSQPAPNPEEERHGADDRPGGDGFAPTSLFTAIQEQLGLRLNATKGPVEVFVIDRVERPTSN
jgi:bla regulator protein BlaR1